VDTEPTRPYLSTASPAVQRLSRRPAAARRAVARQIQAKRAAPETAPTSTPTAEGSNHKPVDGASQPAIDASGTSNVVPVASASNSTEPLAAPRKNAHAMLAKNTV